jgi:hypothetical protein
MMKHKIQFGEESRFDLPFRQTSRTRAASCSGLMHKPWSRTASFRSHLRQFIVKQRNAIRIPIGFQVETGFHFGVEPDE